MKSLRVFLIASLLIGCTHAAKKPEAPPVVQKTAEADPYELVEAIKEPPGTPEDLTRDMETHKDEIYACYKETLVLYPQLAGQIVLEWNYDDQGRVKDAKVVETLLTMPNDLLGDCLLTKVKTWRLPSNLKGQVVHVQFPIQFGLD